MRTGKEAALAGDKPSSSYIGCFLVLLFSTFIANLQPYLTFFMPLIDIFLRLITCFSSSQSKKILLKSFNSPLLYSLLFVSKYVSKPLLCSSLSPPLSLSSLRNLHPASFYVSIEIHALIGFEKRSYFRCNAFSNLSPQS